MKRLWFRLLCSLGFHDWLEVQSHPWEECELRACTHCRQWEGRTITLFFATAAQWGLHSLLHTGSESHLATIRARAAQLTVSLSARALGKNAAHEEAIYAKLERTGSHFFE